jgi:hypothetical protein
MNQSFVGPLFIATGCAFIAFFALAVQITFDLHKIRKALQKISGSSAP